MLKSSRHFSYTAVEKTGSFDCDMIHESEIRTGELAGERKKEDI